MKKFLSHLLIGIGLFFVVSALYLTYLRFNPERLSFSQLPESIATDQTVYPQKLSIPAAQIVAPVIATKLEKNKWATTSQGISYLSTTATPGSQGNSVLYGHNWKNILGNLPDVQPGNEIIVTLSNGTHKKFIVEYTDVVEPTMTSIINQTSDSRLTIYTCTGFLDSKRFVVVAKAV